MATIRVVVLDCDVCDRPPQREDKGAVGLLIDQAVRMRDGRRAQKVKNIFICGFCLTDSKVLAQIEAHEDPRADPGVFAYPGPVEPTPWDMETIVVGPSLREAVDWANANLGGRRVTFLSPRTLHYSLRDRTPGVPVYLLEGWRSQVAARNEAEVEDALSVLETLGSLVIYIQGGKKWLRRASKGRCMDCGLDALHCGCCEKCGRPECDCA